MFSFKKHFFITSIVLLLLGVMGAWTARAQVSGPLLILHGADSTAGPPKVSIYSSVIDPASAQSIEGLGADAFKVRESGVEVQLTGDFSYGPVGLAVVVVIDRGGIAAPGDPRIRQATDLVRELVKRLSVTGAPEDDMIALIGVGQGGVLQPEENFTYDPVDTNKVLNALIPMEAESVRGGTPLYEGLDEALRLLRENPDAPIRNALAHRRKVILVFSDGVDRNFSDEAREQDIIRKATEASISIYSIGMAPRGRGLAPEGEVNLKRLAAQTSGLYFLHNSDPAREEVLAFFDRLMTQRNQYVLTYQTHQPKGAYALQVTVNTDVGSSEKETTFSSVLEPIRLILAAPQDGLEITVPFSPTLQGYAGSLTLSVMMDTPDGVTRTPNLVRYFVNGQGVGDSTASPDYSFTWNPGSDIPVTGRAQTQEFTIYAEAEDPYLGTRVTSGQVKVQITYEAPPSVWRARLWLQGFWWVLLLISFLLIGLLVLMVILFQTRSQIAQRIAAGTTGVVKGITRRLGMQAPASAKLVIIHGPNTGREFRLADPVIKVGRDPQFCDFALYDEYVSNPHFSIQQEHTQFYITDLGSTNGTRVNGVPIPPHQRIPLAPDAIIEAGQARLQFQRLGGTTQQLGQPPGYPPGVPPTSPAPGARGGPTEKVV